MAERRRAALARYAVLDTPAEAEFDDIVRLASEACGVPVSLISLLDGDRQWFKAETGFGRRETPLAASICAHAVQQQGLFEIPDTRADARTAANPLVTGDEHVRFYAGVPLETPDGVALGTLCVLDTKPNRLTASQAFALTTLARQVMTTLELRRALRERRESDRRNAAILESAVDYAIVSMDLAGHVTSWNAGAERILGWSEAELLGRHADAFFTDEDVRDRIACAEMAEALLHGRGADERWHRRKDGSLFWANGEMMPLRAEDGTPEGFLKILRDRTEQRDAAVRIAESENRWRGLFEGMHEGFFLGELLRDADGRPADYRFLEVNPAFVAQSGLPADSAGRTMRELIPGIPLWLVETYARVVETGVPEVFDISVPELGRTFEVRAFKETGARFAALFLDVSERKSTENRRNALTELGDRLRNVSDTGAIASVAAEILGRALGLSHAGYGAVDAECETILVEREWTAPGLGRIGGLHSFREYGSYIEDLKAGTPVVIADSAADPRTAADAEALAAIDVRAMCNLPVMEHGRFVAMFYAVKRTPHAWTPEEVGFVRNVADRTRAAIARIEAEEQQHVLNLELSHRMKNMLAMVQSIATQTMRNAADMASAKDVLSGRLVALGKSHDLLLGGTLNSTPLKDLVDDALQPHRDRPERFVVRGPPVTVGAKAAMSMALILHELATNAAKYGALASAAGRVALTWEILRDAGPPRMHLRWAETGGPPVLPPTRTGFGSRLIGRGLASDFGGEVELTYPPTGVVCTISASLDGLQVEANPAARPRTGSAAG